DATVLVAAEDAAALTDAWYDQGILALFGACLGSARRLGVGPDAADEPRQEHGQRCGAPEVAHASRLSRVVRLARTREEHLAEQAKRGVARVGEEALGIAAKLVVTAAKALPAVGWRGLPGAHALACAAHPVRRHQRGRASVRVYLAGHRGDVLPKRRIGGEGGGHEAREHIERSLLARGRTHGDPRADGVEDEGIALAQDALGAPQDRGGDPCGSRPPNRVALRCRDTAEEMELVSRLGRASRQRHGPWAVVAGGSEPRGWKRSREVSPGLMLVERVPGRDRERQAPGLGGLLTHEGPLEGDDGARPDQRPEADADARARTHADAHAPTRQRPGAAELPGRPRSHGVNRFDGNGQRPRHALTMAARMPAPSSA